LAGYTENDFMVMQLALPPLSQDLIIRSGKTFGGI
jgi:hypothetical protein